MSDLLLPEEENGARARPLRDRLCVLRLGERLLGVEGRHAKGLFPFRERTSVPRIPPYVLGVVNLRGSVEPVLDLSQPLEVGEGHVPNREVPGLIVEAGGLRAVLAVDELVGFEPVDLQQTASLGGGFGKALETYGAGCCEVRQGNVIVLDLERLLADLKPRDVWQSA